MLVAPKVVRMMRPSGEEVLVPVVEVTAEGTSLNARMDSEGVVRMVVNLCARGNEAREDGDSVVYDKCLSFAKALCVAFDRATEAAVQEHGKSWGWEGDLMLTPTARFVPYSEEVDDDGLVSVVRPHFVAEVLVVEGEEVRWYDTAQVDCIVYDLHVRSLDAETEEEREQAADEFEMWFKALCAAVDKAAAKNANLAENGQW